VPYPPSRPRFPVVSVIIAVLTGVAAIVAVVVVGPKLSPTVDGTPVAEATRPAHHSSTTASTPSTPADTGALPPFNPPADLGANCTYPAIADPTSRPAKPPRSGKVPTEPAQVSASVMTDQGPIGLVLDNGKSPCTVNSFASLAQQGFFDKTSCHRLTTDPALSVLQCGDPKGDGTGGPGYEFADEYPTNQFPAGSDTLSKPVVYPRGTLAMANAGPGTNGSQFFLVYKDSQLPPAYTVFGTIDPQGLATVDKIAAAGTADGGTDGQPRTPVNITYIRLD